MEIALLVIGFSLIVLVHELGHFLAAKYVGIKVEQFALGFGPAVFAWRKGLGVRLGTTEKDYHARIQADPTSAVRMGETEYRWNWVPLGGYVKMMGQDDTKPGLVVNDPRSYTSKTVGQRMLVISAGVFMNILFAFIAFMVLFVTGLEVPQARVGSVLPMSPAQLAIRADGSAAALQVGDEILEINGTPQLNDFRKIALNTALARAGQPLDVKVRRVDGTVETVKITPASLDTGAIRLLGIGVGMPRKLTGPELVNEEMREDFAKLPPDVGLLKPDDRITAVNGEPASIDEYWKLDRALQASEGHPVQVTIASATGDTRMADIQPTIVPPVTEASLNFLGMVPRIIIEGVNPKSDAHGKLQPGDIVTAIKVGPDTQYDPTPKDFLERIRKAGAAGTKVTISVLRDREVLTFADLDAGRRLASGHYGLGIVHGYDQEHAILSSGMKDSPAADLPSGSAVKMINGVEVTTWYDVLRELRKAKPGDTVQVLLAPPASAETITRALRVDRNDHQLLASLRYTTEVAMGQLTDSRRTNNPLLAAWWGVLETRDSILQVYVTIQRLFEGSVPFSGMMGPVGMVSVGTKVASQGMDYLLWFLAIISANLAVVNFLPVPVVDGGHFLFLTIEKIQGKPLSDKTMVVAQYIGLAMILTLFVAVTYQDILRMLSLH